MALAIIAVLYAFVILIDPWDTLPLSPPLPRVPISTNARYSFPALARSQRFNAIVLGTSTARLLQPTQLDPAFNARFANLAMNSATAWEQTQLLAVFLRSHPNPRAVIIDIDASWCDATTDRLTPRPFPEWMYQANLWPAYRHMLTPYAVQEAASQLSVMTGLKRRRYGLDGYTSFVPPDADYDPVRVDAAFARFTPLNQAPAAPGAPIALPALPLLAAALHTIPPGTPVTLFFPPFHIERQGTPGSGVAARWAACKQAVAALPNVRVLDFMIPSAITSNRTNYWDPLHYRVAIGARIAAILAGAPDNNALGDDAQRLR